MSASDRHMDNAAEIEEISGEPMRPDELSKTRLGKAWGHVSEIVGSIVIAVLFGQLCLLVFDIVSRNWFGYYYPATQELSQFGLTTLCFGGAVLAHRSEEHIAIKLLVERLPVGWQRFLESLREWVTLGTLALLFYLSIPFVEQDWGQQTPVLGWSEAMVSGQLTIAAALMTVTTFIRLASLPWRHVACSAVMTAVVAGLGVGFEFWHGGIGSDPVSIVLQLIVFTVLVLFGLPIAFALGLASIVYLYFTDIAPTTSVAINFVQGNDNFVLLAVPFFVLTGLIMAEGGVSRRLAEMLRLMVGRVPGGLHIVMITAVFIFSGISGSKIADVIAVGTPLRDVLKRNNYSPHQSAALLAMSAAAGETIPPSVAMLVLASVTTLSVSRLFAAGVVPGAVISLGLIAIVYWQARRLGRHHGAAVERRAKVVAFVHAIPAIVIPILLIGGIVSGVATPTEVSTVAATYSFILTVAIYRELSGRDLWDVLKRTAAMTGVVLFLVAAASAFAWSLTAAGVAQTLAGWMSGMSGHNVLFIILSIVLLICLGALLDGLPALIIFAPLLFPVALSLGFDEVQYGILLIISMGVGHFAPPLGMGCYVATSIMEADTSAVWRAIVPYVVWLTIGALLVGFVPDLSLGLPHLVGD